jgi:hypothetical protein
MTLVDDVTLQAIWWRIVVEPGNDVSWQITVPAGDETGVWAASIYASERRAAVLQAIATSVAGQTVTLAVSKAQNDALLPPGRARFSGHWDVSRTDLAGNRETWVKGPYIINAGLEP